jgi:hypothetical protein
LGHDWGDWSVTKEPTVTEEGEETRICKHDLLHTENRPISTLVLYKSINEIIEFINMQTGGNTADDPIPLFVSINLGTMTEGTSGWQFLLNAIEESGKYVNLDLSYCEVEGTVFNPDYTVVNGKDKIVSIVLPDTVTSIVGGTPGNYAFRYFTNLRFFRANSLETIGNFAFRNSTNLEQITIPANCTDTETFASCPSLISFNLIGSGSLSTILDGKALVDDTILIAYPTANGNVTVPEGITSPGSAFSGNTNLKTINLPSTLTSIGSFSGCTNLEAITLPASITSIGSAFTNCTSLVSFALIGTGPLSTAEGGKALMLNNTELVAYPSATGDITLSTTITSIGSYVFYGCTGLTQITLPPAVTSIPDYAFTGSGLTEITLPELIISIGGNAFQNTSLTKIALPEGLTTIGYGVFMGCTSLKDINLPASLNSIGQANFQNCTSLTEITIPAGVQTIWGWTFSGCASLTLLTCLRTSPPSLAASGHFDNTPSSMQIRVPSGSVESYKANSSWSAYADRISAID